MPDKHPYFYYQPDQLGIRVTNNGDKPDADKIGKAWDFINGEARGRKYRTHPDDAFKATDAKRQYSFTQHTNDGAQTTTYAFRGESNPGNDNFAPQDLPAFVQHINSSNDPLKKDSGLEKADLNWLACGANGISPGDGGPGGPPYPYPPDSGPQVPDPGPLTTPVPYKFKGQLIDDLQNHSGQGISVVILDTAPTADALTKAYLKWVKNASGAEHPILQRLWTETGNNTKLQLKPMLPSTKDRLSKYTIEDHPYSISDHGLFIAGIINTIAPDADLYLYEALSEHGVCDSESVLDRLACIHNKFQGKPVVVNCSLFVLIAYDDKHYRRDFDKRFPDAYPWNDKDGLKAQAAFCEPAFELFHTPDRAVVACAGNDWHHGNAQNADRPPTRYPAAFKSVLGVGALEDVTRHTPAFYSNQEDNPESLGISAFGGGLDDGKRNTPYPPGVIGLYIGDKFPQTPGHPERDNQHGWALWAGTSFATPVVSGLVAGLMSSPLIGNTTDAAANFIKSPPFTHVHGKDNMLEITQG